MEKFLLISFLLIAVPGYSQMDSSIVTFKNSSSVATPRGYSQAATIDLDKCQMIVMSGQVPLDNKGNLAGKDDVAKQAEQVFANIRSIIFELGGSMDNVVKHIHGGCNTNTKRSGYSK